MKHPSYLRVGGALVFKVINAGLFLKFDCEMNHTLAHDRWAGFRAAARAEGLGEMIIGAGMAAVDMTAASWWGGGQYNWTGLYAAVDHDAASFAGRVLPWKDESDYVDALRLNHSRTNAKENVSFQPMPPDTAGRSAPPANLTRASIGSGRGCELTVCECCR